MSGSATTIHNARITLLATIINNITLAFIVAGFVAADRHRAAPGRLARLGYSRLGWAGRGITLRGEGGSWMAAMTWDLALTWFIMPAVVAAIVGLGGIWLAKHTP